ncbi:MAG: hypothetical protein V4608_10070 [Bacteroidota bacterium]
MKILLLPRLKTSLLILVLVVLASGIKAQKKADDNVQTMFVSGENLYAATANAVYYVTDNGLNWKLLSVIEKEGIKITSLAVYGETIFAGTYAHGVFVSYNKGVSWTASSEGIKHLKTIYHAVNAITKVGEKIYIGCNTGQGISDKSALYVSEDQGKNWTVVPDILKKSSITSLQTDGVNVFVYAEYSSTMGVTRLTGDLISSQVFTEDEYKQNQYCVLEKMIFKKNYRGVSVSTDKGQTFTDFGKPLKGLVGIAVIGNNIFAIAEDNEDKKEAAYYRPNTIYVSDINNADWQVAKDPKRLVKADLKPHLKINQNIKAIGVDGDVLYVADEAGLFRVTEDGYAWTLLEGKGLEKMSIRSISAFGKTLYVGTYENDILRSKDEGKTWKPFSSGVSGDITSLTKLGNDLYAGVHNLYYTKEGGIFVLKEGSDKWTRVKTDLKEYIITELRTDGAKLYAKAAAWYEVDIATGVSKMILGVNLHNDRYVVSGSKIFYAREDLYANGNDLNKDDGVLLSTDEGKTYSLFGKPTGEFKKIILVGTTLFGIASTKRGPWILYATSVNKPEWVPAQDYLKSSPVYTAAKSYYQSLAEAEYKNFAAAILKMDEAIKAKPDFIEAFATRADCYNKMNESEKEKADRIISNELKNKPASADNALFVKVMERMKLEIKDNTSWLYLDSYYRDEDALYRKALVTKGLESLWCCDKLISVNTKNDKYYLQRADMNLSLQNFEAALSDYNNSAKINPKNPRYELVLKEKQVASSCNKCVNSPKSGTYKIWEGDYNSGMTSSTRLNREVEKSCGPHGTHTVIEKSLKAIPQ